MTDIQQGLSALHVDGEKSAQLAGQHQAEPLARLRRQGLQLRAEAGNFLLPFQSVERGALRAVFGLNGLQVLAPGPPNPERNAALT